MVTLPGAYHMGFNHGALLRMRCLPRGPAHGAREAGYNIAEAVNFASPTWVPIGQAAKVCTCQRQSVRLDMELFSDVATARRSQRASLARPQATSESANASAAPMPEPSAAATFAPGAPAVSAPPPAPEPDAHAAGGRQLQLKDMWSVRRSLDAGASGGRPRKRKRSHGATLADAVELWARLGRQPPDGSPHEGGATPAPRLNEVVSVQVLPGTVVDAVVVKLSDDASLVKVQGVVRALALRALAAPVSPTPAPTHPASSTPWWAVECGAPASEVDLRALHCARVGVSGQHSCQSQHVQLFASRISERPPTHSLTHCEVEPATDRSTPIIEYRWARIGAPAALQSLTARRPRQCEHAECPAQSHTGCEPSLQPRRHARARPLRARGERNPSRAHQAGVAAGTAPQRRRHAPCP